MVIDLVVTASDDGYTSEVPSIKGCESWAHQEQEAIDKAIELVRFYINLDADTEITIDKAYRRSKSVIYKMIFEKNN